MEAIIWPERSKVIETTGMQSIVYLVRNGQDVRRAEVLLTADVNPVAYGEANADSLYAEGIPITGEVSGISLFFAVQQARARAVHLAAVFAAFNQILIGGDLSEVIAQARAAYSLSPEVLAAVTQFETAYRAGTDEQRQTLSAFAIISIGTLIASQT